MEIHRKSWKFIEYRRWFFCHLLWSIWNWQVRGRLGCSDSPQLQTREGNKYVEMVQHYLKACNVVTLIHHILDLWWSMIDREYLHFQFKLVLQIVLANSAGPLSPMFMTWFWNWRSSICYAQFKLLTEQHNFRTYLSAPLPNHLVVLSLNSHLTCKANLMRLKLREFDDFEARGIDIKNVEARDSLWAIHLNKSKHI